MTVIEKIMERMAFIVGWIVLDLIFGLINGVYTKLLSNHVKNANC